ncbi:TRAP transporter substrate-binding protein [Bacillus sp. B15-48]|uniref:TRAP transporter substrate-binding protein n=1 Tax=Bacillus sp. B15-48 TaxID=1548601 RepID=UPI00193F6D5A|nr:TRAP transporter substrate-binding protein [Bacillus sp. B15-48]MBM4763634.1 DctP family TRAP transporter solute-binding subunit [Bacillus sp. B15-48]
MRSLNKRFITTVLLLLSIIIISACGKSGQTTSSGVNTENSGELFIQVAGIVPQGHPLALGGEKFKELVEEKSDGKIKVEYYPNNQLGSIREQTEQVQMGTIQMAQTLLSTVTSFNASHLQVFEYPFLWPSDEDEIWSILEGGVGELALEKLEPTGLKGFGFWAGGFKAITTKDRAIQSPVDLKGINMRVIPSEILQKTYEAFGANPVPIEFTETYNALQQGVADAQENPLETIYSAKYYEVQDHITIANHGYQFYMMVANSNWFNGLDEGTQKILIEAEEEARVFAKDLTRESIEKKLKEFPELGLEVHELTEEGRQEFIKLSQPLHEELINTPDQKELLESIYEETGVN